MLPSKRAYVSCSTHLQSVCVCVCVCVCRWSPILYLNQFHLQSPLASARLLHYPFSLNIIPPTDSLPQRLLSQSNRWHANLGTCPPGHPSIPGRLLVGLIGAPDTLIVARANLWARAQRLAPQMIVLVLTNTSQLNPPSPN